MANFARKVPEIFEIILPLFGGGTERTMEEKIKRRVEFNVAGIKMSLVTDESDEFVKSIAERMDTMMTRLSHDVKRSQLDAALLCAVDFCADKLVAEKRVRNLEAQISLYDVNNRRLKEEIAALKERLGVKEEALPTENAEATTDADGDAQLTMDDGAGADASRDGKLRMIEALLRRESDK